MLRSPAPDWQLERLAAQLQSAKQLRWPRHATDPDARSMATSGRGPGIVGYNVQTAIDCENHLIVAPEVVNQGHDRERITSITEQAKEAVGKQQPQTDHIECES
jgi:hypothetical protein